MVIEKVPEGVEVETYVELGKTRDVIINFAKEFKVDLIVMSTHGRTGLSHLMIGSVTEDIIRRSTIPTLIIPNTGGEE
jgi:nucleotide-binding universal stress UspA family protein